MSTAERRTGESGPGQPPTGCPAHGRSTGAGVDVGERKTSQPGEAAGPALERTVDAQGRTTWHVRSAGLVREILRASQAARQAGFGSDVVRRSMPLKHWPVLYGDGPEHRAQRTKIGRFFAPATVTRRYRELMAERADAFLAALDDGRPVDLSELTLHFSAQVAARVIGLTESDQEKMAHRLVAFFDQPAAVLGPPPVGWRRITTLPASLPGMVDLLRFWAGHVRPAVRARRAHREEDVISHLLDEGYSGLEILMECVTYGAAGMVTTREFLQVAAWHLLERPDLRARFLEADSPERQALLHEILRLEPVVGHLYRRVEEEITVHADGQDVVLRAGDRVDLAIRPANADPEAAGEDGLALCPGRRTAKGYRPEVMSFGDGPHRCPGNAVAMVESEILLERLLARDVEMAGEPRVEWEDIIAGYAIRGLVLRQRPAAA